MNFQDLGLVKPIVRAVTAQGYSTPTPIQAQSIPEALEGRDVLGCAQTGTGKTCAFALPILQRLAGELHENGQPKRKPVHGRAPRALILCPTRELASQIFDSFCTYGRQLKLHHTCVFGGVSQYKQVRDLRAGVDILVATPGRLHDLINQGYIDLSEVETLVLDEADRMLDMGFINDIKKVVEMLPEHQTLFFSATISNEIRRLADSMLRDPVRVETAPEATTIDAIAQKVYLVKKENKPELLGRILDHDETKRTLVFTRTKYGADKLTKILRRNGVNADAIHGDKSQNARTRAMQGFKRGKTTVLVATDVASRGIDVDNITHVVNFDMPIDPETYVHRIGRTARAGATGVAVSFCDRDELGTLRAIERRSNIRIDIGDDFPELTVDPAMASHQKRPSYHAPRKFSPGKRGPARGRPNNDRSNDSSEAARPRKSKANGRSRKVSSGGGGGGGGGGRYAKASSGRPGKAGTKSRQNKSNASRGKRKASPAGRSYK